MNGPGSPRVCRLAVASFVCGMVSPVLPIAASVPALVLGLLGLRAVNANEGRLTGRGIAVAGMLLGGGVTLMSVICLVALALVVAREKSGKIECMDNFRQIGRAVNLSFEHDKKRFPAAALPNPTLPPEQRFSWYVGLLPYMEQQKDGTGRWQSLASGLDLEQAWDAPVNRAVLSTNISRFLCPSHPSHDPRAARGWTHYVGMTGFGPESVWLTKNHRDAGFFGFNRVIGENDLGGGLSYTMVATETTLRNGPWLAAGDSTLRGLDRQDMPYIGVDRQFGGFHAKGMNVLFADGSCRFYNTSVRNLAFEQMIPLLRHEP